MADDYFDLIVWYQANGQIHGFQLCYDKRGHERALTWTHSDGFWHSSIDAGESNPANNATPVLMGGGTFPIQRVKDEFLARSISLSEEIRALVLTRIDEYKQSA